MKILHTIFCIYNLYIYICVVDVTNYRKGSGKIPQKQYKK